MVLSTNLTGTCKSIKFCSDSVCQQAAIPLRGMPTLTKAMQLSEMCRMSNSDSESYVCSGSIPSRGMPTVILSTQLTEVRGFSDFYSEFYVVRTSCLPMALQSHLSGTHGSTKTVSRLNVICVC